MNQTPYHDAVSLTDRVTDEQDSAGVENQLLALARRDVQRPVFHFVSPAGWLNDPNGVSWRNGAYHLFYQYNPLGAFHHRIHWGHAVSTDLLHWEDRPIALTPGEGADDDGCWSGVLVDAPQGPALVYSGRVGEHELPCVAFGTEDLDTWVPQSRPIIDSAPRNYEVTAFRDHCVWFEGGTWRQLVGSGIKGQGGCAFMYESTDFLTWQERGVMVVGQAGETDLENPEWTGTMWECVDFFMMCPGERGATGTPDGNSGHPHVMIFSAWHEHHTLHSMAAVGTYDGQTFTPHRVQRLDLGGRHAYAPQTFVDESGRRVLWAWMQEGRGEAAQLDAGWSGAMAIPRRLWLTSDLQLCTEPVAEVSTLRGPEIPVDAGAQEGQMLCTGTVLDIELQVEIPLGGAVTVDVFATAPESGGGVERTGITVQRDSSDQVTLSVNRSQSSLDSHCADSDHSGPVPHAEDAPLRLRVLLDKSSLEIFTEGVSLTTRIYPTRSDAEHVILRRLDRAVVKTARAWEMRATEQSHRQMYPELAV